MAVDCEKKSYLSGWGLRKQTRFSETMQPFPLVKARPSYNRKKDY
jgi:hypothetical protein